MLDAAGTVTLSGAPVLASSRKYGPSRAAVARSTSARVTVAAVGGSSGGGAGAGRMMVAMAVLPFLP